MNYVAWKDFCVAVSGAASALAGLVFVALSINLTKIIASPGLPSRAGETLIVLSAALLTSLMLAMPPQPDLALGLELAVVGGLGWLVPAWFQAQTIRKHTYVSGLQLAGRMFLHATSMLAIVAAGLMLAIGASGAAYWLAAGVLIALVVGLLNAWILLVEIER